MCLYEFVRRVLSVGPCKYYKVCPYYDKKNYTCNVYDAEGGYCGKFREFEEKEARRK